MKRLLQLAVLSLYLAPTAAIAHVGVGDTTGFDAWVHRIPSAVSITNLQ